MTLWKFLIVSEPHLSNGDDNNTYFKELVWRESDMCKVISWCPAPCNSSVKCSSYYGCSGPVDSCFCPWGLMVKTLAQCSPGLPGVPLCQWQSFPSYGAGVDSHVTLTGFRNKKNQAITSLLAMIKCSIFSCQFSI